MTIVVMPISAFALDMGFKLRRIYNTVVLGFISLTCLIMTVILGKATLVQFEEKSVTLIGAFIMYLFVIIGIIVIV